MRALPRISASVRAILPPHSARCRVECRCLTTYETTDWIGDAVPKWVWGAFGVVAAFAIFRGKEFKFRFPETTVPQWFVSSLVIFFFVWVSSVLPVWAWALIYSAFFIGAIGLDMAAGKGRANFLRLNDNSPSGE